ncbi:TetR/AcrR family transcriptional regulator [uncultured Streptomyces sp.]|uniref:TetR/AcrR family transcriptional regulator n=1 Tax=uncultured Streptomyces sp. TaxID=174707 RepID=UPI002636BEDC|nr:TetR/AcrR family transcriptional regulator [uncultured Streptomyces sp.]
MPSATTDRTPDDRRPMRADARRNHDRLLGEARELFAEQGTDASLEDLARRAGVGIGTLYRHFPNRHALMNAVFQDALCDLLARSHALEAADRPCRALVEWLGAIVAGAGAYRGLAQALMSASRDETSALAQCHGPLREAGARLLERAQRSGDIRPDVSVGDLLQLTHAIALAAEQAPDDPGLADRLLLLTLQGLRGPGHG